MPEACQGQAPLRLAAPPRAGRGDARARSSRRPSACSSARLRRDDDGRHRGRGRRRAEDRLRGLRDQERPAARALAPAACAATRTTSRSASARGTARSSTSPTPSASCGSTRATRALVKLRIAACSERDPRRGRRRPGHRRAVGAASRPTSTPTSARSSTAHRRQGRARRRASTSTRAADILWTLNHPDVWQLLVGERGWTPERVGAVVRRHGLRAAARALRRLSRRGPAAAPELDLGLGQLGRRVGVAHHADARVEPRLAARAAARSAARRRTRRPRWRRSSRPGPAYQPRSRPSSAGISGAAAACGSPPTAGVGCSSAGELDRARRGCASCARIGVARCWMLATLHDRRLVGAPSTQTLCGRSARTIRRVTIACSSRSLSERSSCSPRWSSTAGSARAARRAGQRDASRRAGPRGARAARARRRRTRSSPRPAQKTKQERERRRAARRTPPPASCGARRVDRRPRARARSSRARRRGCARRRARRPPRSARAASR